jgi:hypothetical protein
MTSLVAYSVRLEVRFDCNYLRLRFEIVTSIISIKLIGSPFLLMFNRNLKKVDQQFYRIDTATVNLVRFTNDE